MERRTGQVLSEVEVGEATARWNRGQLAAQGASAPEPSEAKGSHLAQEVPSGTGWKAVGRAEGRSQPHLIKNAFAARSTSGSTLQGDKRWMRNCCALAGVKQATSPRLS